MDLQGIPSAPDGGWGWIIAIVSFLCNFIVDGISFSFGALMPSLIASLNTSRFMVSWISSIQLAALASSGPIASILGSYIGFRNVALIGSILSAIGMFSSSYVNSPVPLFVTMGLCCGVGFGLLYLSGMIMVSIYFDERRALATAIAVCGSSLGLLTISAILPILEDFYEWQGTVFILSALILNGIPLSILYHPLPMKSRDSQSQVNNITLSPTARENNTLIIGENCIFQSATSLHSLIVLPINQVGNRRSVKSMLLNFNVFKNTKVTLYILMNTFFFFFYPIPFGFTYDRALTLGIEEKRAKLFLTLIGLASFIARIISGLAGNSNRIEKVHLLIVAVLGSAILNAFIPLCKTFGTILCYSIGIGFCTGVYATLQTTILCELVNDINLLPSTIGLLVMIQGISILLTGPVAGLIFDMTQSYDYVFIYCSANCLISFFLLIAMMFDSQCNEQIEDIPPMLGASSTFIA